MINPNMVPWIRARVRAAEASVATVDAKSLGEVADRIEELEALVEYWQKRHDILRDRYEPEWGNG
jgi:hypothetical protein